MFDLKKPCKDCPFRVGKGERFQLSPERITEIFEAPAFQCHKTLEGRPQQCAGLISVQHKIGRPNQITQVATRFTSYDPAALVSTDTYDTLEAVREAHTRS